MATESLPFRGPAVQQCIAELPDSNPRLPPTPPQSLDAKYDSQTRAFSLASRIDSAIGLELDTPIRFPLPPPSTIPTAILELDKKTPDSHVPRDPRLIRLTGTHPFNVEAPLSALYDEGFLTTPELFYVRNHGHVPQVADTSIPNWEFSVEGLVSRPFTITLRDLIADYEQITVPITLVCAGNRRKEQNQVRKSKGFSWGAAGVSTALWTGVPLSEVLRRALPKRGARYVCMEGADKLPNGYYGTSVKLNWALDDNKGIMLAYKMNGEMLRPDHGRPLRVVVPGQIGGRSVKWLKKITVTSGPSENWYHLYDNRVLPTMVSPEESANDKKWWVDERYAIYELSTNSATVYPAHEEKVSLIEGEGPESYKVRGYAYGGGGRRIARVEVTLDKGKSWMLANIDYPEDAYREHADENMQLFGGRLDMSWRESSFCWCFWDLEIPIEKLRDAKDIMVRAMDESLNVQPRDMYWSVLGMMNNPWFRITVEVVDEGRSLRFEHPTLPALMAGGWMERVKKEGGDLANGFWGEKIEGPGAEEVVKPAVVEIKMTSDAVKREITLEELKAHDKDEEPWFVVNGEVYDGRKFLEGHPGGATSIIGAAGQDATDEFMAIHSETAKFMMPHYHIGTLSATSLQTLQAGSVEPEPDTSTRSVFLTPKSWTRTLLSSKKIISPDARIFTFTLQHAHQLIGLPIGQHLMIRLRDPVTREAIIRSYTPYSPGSQKGTLDVLVKIYFDSPGTPGGKMTMALESLPLGHPVEFKGPVGKFEYRGRGACTIGSKERKVKRFIMICGGSGITPIFQVLRAVLEDSQDTTECVVLDGNRTEQDILCREEMKVLVRGKEGRCRVLHTLSKPSDEWEGLRGRVGKELLEGEVGRCEGNGKVLVLVCGPEAMEREVKIRLAELGWAEEDVLFF